MCRNCLTMTTNFNCKTKPLYSCDYCNEYYTNRIHVDLSKTKIKTRYYIINIFNKIIESMHIINKLKSITKNKKSN